MNQSNNVGSQPHANEHQNWDWRSTKCNNKLVYEWEEYCGETNLFIVIVIAFWNMSVFLLLPRLEDMHLNIGSGLDGMDQVGSISLGTIVESSLF